MTKTTTAEFFLRFYNQTDTGVAECVEKLMSANPRIVGYRFDTPKLRTSPFGGVPSHEVRLQFATDADAEAMMGNPQMRDIYRAYAAPNMKSTFVEKRPGDAAYS